jgi:tetratricopeptide (TPR) repeat protein
LLGLVAGALMVLSLGGCSWGTDSVEEIEAVMAEGQQLLDSLNYNDAGKLYLPLLERLPEDDAHWPEVAFAYANCLWHQTPPNAAAVDEATALFGRIAETLPDTDWAAASLLSIARIEMLRDFPGDQENPQAAIPILERLIAEQTGLIRHEAVIRLSECHRMALYDWDSIETSLTVLRDWLARHPDNPLAALMWQQIAMSELLDFKRPEAALDALIQAEVIGFADPSRKGQLLWLMAELALGAQRFPEAVEYYQRLIIESPTSGRAYEAQLRLERIRATVPGMEEIEIPPLSLIRD